MNIKPKPWRNFIAFLQRKLGKRSEEPKEGNRFTAVRQSLDPSEQRNSQEKQGINLSDNRYNCEERKRELDEWFQLQPEKLCIACRETKKADNFGYSQFNRRGDGLLEPILHQRCKPCHQAWRDKLDTLCHICGNKTKSRNYLRKAHGYSLIGNGLKSIQICCETCEPAFLALPINQQKALICKACNKAYPTGQVIYGLYDPRDNKVRNIGRTSDTKRRFRDHLKSSSPLLHIYEDRKQWYTKSNWIYDLLTQRLEPIMKIIKYVDISPKAPEWERRYILHGIQQGWELLNIETMDEHLVNRAQNSHLNFLEAPFEGLVKHRFFRENGLEAFVHKWYEPVP